MKIQIARNKTGATSHGKFNIVVVCGMLMAALVAGCGGLGSKAPVADDPEMKELVIEICKRKIRDQLLNQRIPYRSASSCEVLKDTSYLTMSNIVWSMPVYGSGPTVCHLKNENRPRWIRKTIRQRACPQLDRGRTNLPKAFEILTEYGVSILFWLLEIL